MNREVILTSVEPMDTRRLTDEERRALAKAIERHNRRGRSRSPDLRAGSCARASDKGTVASSKVEIK